MVVMFRYSLGVIGRRDENSRRELDREINKVLSPRSGVARKANAAAAGVVSASGYAAKRVISTSSPRDFLNSL